MKIVSLLAVVAIIINPSVGGGLQTSRFFIDIIVNEISFTLLSMVFWPFAIHVLIEILSVTPTLISTCTFTSVSSCSSTLTQ